MMVEARAAGKKRPMMREARDGRAVLMGGSDTRPTWKKSMGKMEPKNTTGEVVHRDKRVVKVKVTARRGHRRSVMQSEDNPERKVYDFGNDESNPILLTPFCREAAKSLRSPVRATTPQPPR